MARKKTKKRKNAEVVPLIDNDAALVEVDHRQFLFDFLGTKNAPGKFYEYLMIVLIVANVIAFIFSTIFVEEYNPVDWAKKEGGLCGSLCDSLVFGNHEDNDLAFLGIGSTSVLELVTVLVFTMDYMLRLYVVDLEDDNYKGFMGRIRYIPTFFSIVDLASTLPFFLDAFVFRGTEYGASSFLRILRLFRMMRVEGRYDTALTMMDDVWAAQKDIMGTALFVGVTTWLVVSTLYHLVERRSVEMIYCGAAPDYCEDDIDVSLCIIDHWGIADCTAAGCPPTDEVPEPCYNLYQSISMASYYALLNLFGEFPLIDNHNLGGKIVGTLTAIIAVAVFALPVGIIGNGFEEQIEKRRKGKETELVVDEEAYTTEGHKASDETITGRLYNLLHSMEAKGAVGLDYFICFLVLVTSFTFMLDTVTDLPAEYHLLLESVEFVSVLFFTVEYILRVISVTEDPKYKCPGGRLQYMMTFTSICDLLSVLPYWVEACLAGAIITPHTNSPSTGTNLVSALRLLRLLRFDRYTRAFASFDDIIRANSDILEFTAFTALLLWVFFAAILYYTERDNPDQEMADNYKTVPDAMWMTLLNLAGEAPLCQYSNWGKVVTGFLGVFATGIFGIPIGVLGAGFEEIVEGDSDDESEEQDVKKQGGAKIKGKVLLYGSFLEQASFSFVNGIGSGVASFFELMIYTLICVTVAISVWQTVPGQENDFNEIEWFAVVVFTFEYLIRFIGVGADPEFAKQNTWITGRLRFLVSFYSIVDLLAIVPFFLSVFTSSSFLDEYDMYLRMFRILRLAKLDKYIPSITLIDDVLYLKAEALKVAAVAAFTLWILFAALLYSLEHKDTQDSIDNVPQYGCNLDCNMSDRFQNFFDSMVYTGVHLTGDYPITTYTWPARFVNFFMVIAAVGVVSIPSGLIASGFVELVQTKKKKRKGKGQPGDDWYEESLRGLQGVDPPKSSFGPIVDQLQLAVELFLNGKEDEKGIVRRSLASSLVRMILFTVIILNVIAVVAESEPTVQRAISNDPGNIFDQFESFTVVLFSVEYTLRLFCAPKSRSSLYSSFVYATTFFGLVDLLSTAPWYLEQYLIATDVLTPHSETAKFFRVLRIFRILQLEDFVVAFSKLDNVFRASQDVLKATGIMALVIWVGCGALFFIFEENNPNWRECDASVPLDSLGAESPGCYSFPSTGACNAFYPGLCTQKAFTDMPNSLYYTAVFLGGEWGVIDFTWPGRLVCLFLCVAGIGLYAIPVGSLFDSFGAILGLGGDEDDEDDE